MKLRNFYSIGKCLIYVMGFAIIRHRHIKEKMYEILLKIEMEKTGENFWVRKGD